MIRRAQSFFLAAAVCVALPAFAGEGSFGWIYTLDLQPKGELEFEQRLQLTRQQASGTYDFWRSRSELAYGLTDNLQIGAYVNAYSINASKNYTNSEACPSGPCTAGFGVPVGAGEHYSSQRIDGGSLEAIWRITNPVTSPVGVGLYADATLGKLSDEYEARLIIQSNFLDDSLTIASNVVYAAEKLKFFDSRGASKEAMVDVLAGVSYRFAPRWSAGFEYRFHNDFNGYGLDQHSQAAHFGGPNMHYAEKDFWVTAAWRHQFGGSCYGSGTTECSGGYVWDSHGRDEFILRLGIPLGD